MSIREINQTILVSGASGFLGSEIVRQLLNDGSYKVIAMSSRKGVLHAKFGNSPNLKVVNTANWSNEIDQNVKIDILVNCAFPRTANGEQLAKGLLFTEKLVKGSINLGIKKIINISSQSVYSQKAKSITNEESPVIPETFYGMTKYASERIVSTICESSNENVAFSNIRLASLSGIELEVRMTNRFVKSALAGNPIEIHGGSQRISYLDVRDASSALVAMVKSSPSGWSKVYNLGNNSSFTILELAETIKSMSSKYTENQVRLLVQEGQNSFSNQIDSDLFYNDFNWRPSIIMPDMVKDLFEYYLLV
ncbi:NAD-dependent epimerase/dehydratase family protein [Alteribacter aurantiacus]|uniref:NAD-dependent epimerase/dehydratase family protein n=1 Tax=Alteribacter aurantiacus TaxID=254410 RepID=UPI00041BB972|nr:NAD(P)-dependent oxidoreductase [Alteribacter aurantiacus]